MADPKTATIQSLLEDGEEQTVWVLVIKELLKQEWEGIPVVETKVQVFSQEDIAVIRAKELNALNRKVSIFVSTVQTVRG